MSHGVVRWSDPTATTADVRTDTGVVLSNLRWAARIEVGKALEDDLELGPLLHGHRPGIEVQLLATHGKGALRNSAVSDRWQ